MHSTWARRAVWIGFALAVLLQLVVLYAPSTPDGTPSIPGADKVIHVAVFLLPALLGVLAGIRPLPLGVVLVAHAIGSELVQHVLLPERSGDAWDAVADIVGIGLGLALGVAIARRANRMPGRSAS
ncbi:VanZ family protein [Agrococcus sp. ARC_14]|uniref:VanZ family protein n=1 Tax=Agrococcus sp. ARC_14 TaxID=2919927 RepID=UPI001F06BD50|nr:VanZ family protein [Agrococcus sp. ARC_14]MCH1884011.1 VanZ family protein [Agrococcus sp. ARC_14]